MRMKKGSKEELNRLGREWYEANPRMKERLAGEIFNLAYAVFPSYEDAIGEFFICDWKWFDPDTADLYGYMSKYLKWRSETLYHEDQGHRRLQVKGNPTAEEENTEDDDAITVSEEHEDQFTKATEEEENNGANGREGKKERLWTPMLSLDAPIGEGGERTWLDMFGEENPVDSPLEKLLCEDTAIQFITLALSFRERLTGRANNKTRLNYFRMFFSDSVVDLLHGGFDSRPFAAHERELFDQALHLGFLDYFMRKVCRRISELCVCPVKPYGELVEGRPMDREPGHPLPNDVYMTYLNTREGYAIRSAGTISSQRKAYKDILRKSLC